MARQDGFLLSSSVLAGLAAGGALYGGRTEVAVIFAAISVFWLLGSTFDRGGRVMDAATPPPVRRAVVPAFCRVCGYDLRATPARCPECGTPVN